MNIHFLNDNVKCISLSNEKCMSVIHSLAKICIHSKMTVALTEGRFVTPLKQKCRMKWRYSLSFCWQCAKTVSNTAGSAEDSEDSQCPQPRCYSWLCYSR